MFSNSRRLTGLIIGASVGAVGWGAVLPFIYADVATARGFGPTAAAITFTAFAIGALMAAPAAGRWADRSSPLFVATAARLAMVLADLGLMFSDSALGVWTAALGYGAALAVVQPSISVLVLDLVPAERRRDAFAWQFIGQNLALAVGGLVGGFMVDLSTPTGTRPAYAFAAVASLLSAALVVAVAGGRDRRAACPLDEPADTVGYREVLRAPGIGWLLGVSVLLTLAFYAQFDSGLPAYALTFLSVHPTVLGTAVAVNAVLVAALTAPVLSLTRSVRPSTLLASCAGIWVGVWLVLGVSLLHRNWGSALIIAGYALFSVGETMLAPVLTPLAAGLAPDGATGRTLAALSGSQTFATAVGPGLSAALLALGLPAVFIAMQILCCVVAVIGARHLGRITHDRGRDVVADPASVYG